MSDVGASIKEFQVGLNELAYDARGPLVVSGRRYLKMSDLLPQTVAQPLLRNCRVC
jgi:hypothetical protein